MPGLHKLHLSGLLGRFRRFFPSWSLINIISQNMCAYYSYIIIYIYTYIYIYLPDVMFQHVYRYISMKKYSHWYWWWFRYCVIAKGEKPYCR
jgi:hypothetical protein